MHESVSVGSVSVVGFGPLRPKPSETIKSDDGPGTPRINCDRLLLGLGGEVATLGLEPRWRPRRQPVPAMGFCDFLCCSLCSFFSMPRPFVLFLFSGVSSRCFSFVWSFRSQGRVIYSFSLLGCAS